MQKGGRADTIGVLEIGTLIRIPVDKVDRGKMDHNCVPGVIVAVTEHTQYRVVCKAGLFKQTFHRSSFYVESGRTALQYDLHDALTDWENKPKVQSIRTALAAISMMGGQGHIHCSCTTLCDTARCTCKKANLLCNSRCHKSNTCCSNK